MAIVCVMSLSVLVGRGPLAVGELQHGHCLSHVTVSFSGKGAFSGG